MIRLLVLSMIVMQMWAIKSAAETGPSFPGMDISNSSTTGVSLSGNRWSQSEGKLTLNSTGANLVYALFPYNPSNTSEPSMGSFITYFSFKRNSSIGAIGFIAIDPDSNKTKLEDRLLSIANREYFYNKTRVYNSSYLAVVYNFTRDLRYVTMTLGGEPVGSFDVFADAQEQNYTATLIYGNPASMSKRCRPIYSNDSMCPSSVVTLAIFDTYGYSTLDAKITPSNFTLSASRLVGFFAFGGGAFEVSYWQFTDINGRITILNASAASDAMSIPYPGSILNFMLMAFLLIFSKLA